MAGLPFNALVGQEKQSWRSEDGLSEIQHLQSAHRFSGFLLGPQSWQGESLWESHQVRFQIGGKVLQGFCSQARMIMQGGMLQFPMIRLLGDDYSITGNALFSLRGEALANLRIIGSRASAMQWQQQWLRAFPQQALPLQPIWNEDRLGMDILCGGTFEQSWLSFDHGKQQIDVRKLMQHLNQASTARHP
jgi:hypothetical protein